jgi:hypothetical protein
MPQFRNPQIEHQKRKAQRIYQRSLERKGAREREREKKRKEYQLNRLLILFAIFS